MKTSLFFLFLSLFSFSACVKEIQVDVDQTGPSQPSLTATPNAFSNSLNASFAFTGSSSNFECKLDDEVFAKCTSPMNYRSLSVNKHTFEVRSKDQAGKDSAITTYSWTIDNVIPTTPVITGNIGSVTKLNAASLTFSSTDISGIASFQCSLDNAAYNTCTSPHALSNLTNGNHSLKVKAIDVAGNFSNEGAYTWMVDQVVPTLVFSLTPATSLTSTTASFTFSFSDSGSGINSVQCSLDSAAFANCTSPITLSNLAVAAHLFRVQAMDKAGNASLIAHAFTVTGSTPSPTPTPAPAPSLGLSFYLSSPITQVEAPFTIGQAFRKGDVPNGYDIGADIVNFHASVKNRWPDGSVKFAVLAGRADLTSGVTRTITLKSVVSKTPVAPLTTSDLRNSGVTASVGFETSSANWSSADWDSPFINWIAGPEMSSWIYRKPIGTDPHLVAWIEVRLFKGGSVEILPWIENGYLLVPGPTSKAGKFTFSMNGSSKFNSAITLPHHTRTPLINGTALSYWSISDPEVTLYHNTQYLQASELVPSYGAVVAATAPGVANIATSYTPLQAGGFKYYADNMAESGYHSPIGLLPEHDVLYLTHNNPKKVYEAVVRNGFSAGRYAIHYRDEKTNRPIRFSSYPTLGLSDGSNFKDNGATTGNSVTPKPSGVAAPGWDTAHSPSVGYMAYLVTGRWYFMEEVQFAATVNYLGKSDNIYMRTGSQALVQTATGAWQTRSTAWDWRSLMHALSVTPDDDSVLHSEFKTAVENNINFFHNKYVAKPGNPFGFIMPGEGYDSITGSVAVWQQDFVTATFGWSLSLGLPVSPEAATKLSQFFTWKAKSAVGRLGANTSNSWWYVNAFPYVLKVSNSNPDYSNGTGFVATTWREAYNLTYTYPPAWMSSTEGMLAFEYMSDPARGMFANFQPAIAYAVRHQVPGAVEGYSRMTSAINWQTLKSNFDTFPVWSVKPLVGVTVTPPKPTSTPSWLANKPVNQWFEIPGTSGAGGAMVDAWGALTLKDDTNELFILASGGHGDSYDNRVVSIKLTDDSPTWVLRNAPSPLSQIVRDVAYYNDGKPTSRHNYQHTFWVPSVNRFLMMGGFGIYGAGYNVMNIDGFNPDTNQWDPANTWPMMPSTFGTAIEKGTDIIWTSGSLKRFHPKTATFSTGVTNATQLGRWPVVHDPNRNQMFSLQYGDGQGYDLNYGIQSARVPVGGTTQIPVKFNPSEALTQFIADAPNYSAMDYDPVNDQYLFYYGQGSSAGRIYVIKPNTTNMWDMSILKLATNSPIPPAIAGAGVNGRFLYIPSLKGVVMLPSGASNLWFIRTSGN